MQNVCKFSVQARFSSGKKTDNTLTNDDMTE